MVGEISRKRIATTDGMYHKSGLVIAIAWDYHDELTHLIVGGLQAVHETMETVMQDRKMYG